MRWCHMLDNTIPSAPLKKQEIGLKGQLNSFHSYQLTGQPDGFKNILRHFMHPYMVIATCTLDLYL